MKRAIALFFLAAACIVGFLCIRVTADSQIPHLGTSLLFFQTTTGLIASIIVFFLLVVFLYRHELRSGVSVLHRGIFAPIIDEEKRSSQLLSRKIESTERRMSTTEQALEKFATAIGDYATHLSSHTSAIQGLAEASQELKNSAADQNRVLSALLYNIDQPGVLWQAPPVKQTPLVKQVPPVDQTPPVKKEKPAPEKTIAVVKSHKSYRKPGIFDDPMPPGCALSRETRTSKALAAQKEISNALHNLQSRLESVQN